MKIIEIENGCKIFSWCPDVEEEAMNQMKIVATNLPFVRHVSLMPDCHLGQNTCIGSVIACDGVVVPDFVGADIGCGMGAIKTSINKSELEDEDRRKKLLHSFGRGIPVGFAHNNQKRIEEIYNKYGDKIAFLVDKSGVKKIDHCPVGNIESTILEQLGTLGGGNHFCEVQHDENNNVWIMLHSGSRNIGKKVGDYFNELATNLNKKWYSKGFEVPFLPVDTVEGEAYLAWMDLSLRFAYLNRKIMLDVVRDCLEHEFPEIKYLTNEICKDANDNILNIHHNFASLENHFGKNYWIHRKGATMARSGMTGIIPGSMGTSSYIVNGLGNQMSMSSCSHGAGRKMGRREFCRRMKDNYVQVEESLKGVVHSDFGEIEHGKDKGMKDVSEAPGAYKDIDWVIAQELDLINPIVKLSPLICLKG